MTWNPKKLLLGTALSLLMLLACIALGLLPLNLFFLKTTLNETVRERSGAELTIEGPLRLTLGLSPELTAGNITLNFPEVAQQPSAFIRGASIRTRMLSVLRGDIDLRRLTANGIVVDFESEEVSSALPDQLSLDATAPLDQALNIQINGQSGEDTLSLSLTGASLNSLLQASREYPIDATLGTAASSVQFDGVLLLPWSTPGVAGKLIANSNDASALLRQFGLELPALGPLAAQSDIRISEKALQIENMEGVLDELAFMLSVTVRDWSSRPWFEVTAHFPQLDLNAIPGMSRNPSTGGTTGKTELQPVFDQLSGFDGRAEVAIGQIQNAPLSLRDLVIKASLQAGRLSIEDATGTLSGTGLKASASLDTSAACPQLETSIQISRFELETLAPFLEPDSDLAGNLEDSRIRTNSCGSSVDHHITSLQTAITVAGVTLVGPQEQPPLRLANITAEVNWQQAGRISFETELMDELLTVAVDFGSVEHLTGDVPWPLDLSARANSFGLELSGQTALQETDLILDLSLDARLGDTDLSGQLAWSGQGSGKPLKMNILSELLDLRDIETLLPASSRDEPDSERDWTEFLNRNTPLHDWLVVPGFDVMLVVNQLRGTPFDINNIGLDARLVDRTLENGRMRLDYEGVQLEGVLNADMSDPTWLVDYRVILKNLDIGRVMKSMELSDAVDARAEQAEVHFESEGSTPQELVQNLRFESRLQSVRWTFAAGPEKRLFEIDLSDLSVLAVPGSDVTWETSGSLDGSPVKARLTTPNLRATFDEKLPLPARLIIGTGHDVAMIDVVVHPESDRSLYSEIQVSGRYANAEDIDFAGLPAPLEDYALSTNLTISKDEYLASDIKARVGSSNATGTFRIQPSGPGYHFSLGVESPLLETDDLLRWINEIREMSEVISRPESADTETEELNVGLIRLVDQYIDEFIGDNSWAASLNIHELRSSGNLLGAAEFGLEMDSRQLILEPVTIRLPGGNVVANYRAYLADSGWDYQLESHIERLEYGGLLRLYDPDSKVSGVVHLNTSLSSHAEVSADAVRHLNGTIDLAVFPHDVGAQFLDLWASNVVFALLQFGENQDKQLNCMVSRFEVENGVMKSRDTFLDSTEIIVRVRGEIDLADKQLNLLAVPQAKVEKFLSVAAPIEVTGPFDDFSVGVASGGFIKTMIRWYYGLIYVPWKWITGERFPADGIATCFRAMDWDPPTEAR